MNILVIAPHPDDEVLGCGGTIARFASDGHHVAVAIVTHGDPSMFPPALVEQVQQEAREAHRSLGVAETRFLEGFPAALLDTIPHAKLNAALGNLFRDLQPEILFIPFYGDLHLDHRLVFESAMVAARPGASQTVRTIYAYETLSETNWNAPMLTPGFLPNVYFDITNFLEMKLKAMSAYQSQLKPFPDERSLEAINNLAGMRGATVGVKSAEAFVLIRKVC